MAEKENSCICSSSQTTSDALIIEFIYESEKIRAILIPSHILEEQHE